MAKFSSDEYKQISQALLALYEIKGSNNPYLTIGQVAGKLKSSFAMAERILRQLLLDKLVAESEILDPVSRLTPIFAISSAGVILIDDLPVKWIGNPYGRFQKKVERMTLMEIWTKRASLINIGAAIIFGASVMVTQIRGCHGKNAKGDVCNQQPQIQHIPGQRITDTPKARIPSSQGEHHIPHLPDSPKIVSSLVTKPVSRKK